MDNIAGAPVEGENFYARQDKVNHIREVLENDDVLLLGPRRIGKTSISRAVIAMLRTEGWGAVEINVASCQDERGFLAKLESALRPELESLAEKATTMIGNAWDSLTKRIKSVKVSIPNAAAVNVDLGGVDSEEWTQVGNDLLKLIAKAEKRWLIYIDELPIFLFALIRNDPQTGVQRVRRFLDWFRNDVRAMPETHTVRWLVSGSVGLDTLVQQHNMADTINSMRHMGLEAFSPDVAVAMLRTLAGRYQTPLSADHALLLVSSINWPQPYYLQVAFNRLRSLIATEGAGDMPGLIEKTIDHLTEPGADNDFFHWQERLSIQLSVVDAVHSVALLSSAAKDRNGARADNLLAELHGFMPNATAAEAMQGFVRLRDILMRDAYWFADESSGHKRYRFRLEPLRRWWLRRTTL